MCYIFVFVALRSFLSLWSSVAFLYHHHHHFRSFILFVSLAMVVLHLLTDLCDSLS